MSIRTYFKRWRPLLEGLRPRHLPDDGPDMFRSRATLTGLDGGVLEGPRLARVIRAYLMTPTS